MQTTFKYGNTQNISSTPNDTWNGFLCHHMWRHKLLNIVHILWSTLYSQYIHTVVFGFLHLSFFYSCVQFIFINLYSCNNCSCRLINFAHCVTPAAAVRCEVVRYYFTFTSLNFNDRCKACDEQKRKKSYCRKNNKIYCRLQRYKS